jgi:protein ECT2
MVVKRNTTDKPGRVLAGLDDVNKAARGGGLMNFGFGPSSVSGKRSGMSCKGVVDITDIVATDVSDGGMCP